MTVLALDTSTTVAGLALVTEYQVLAEDQLEAGLTHSRTLLPAIQRMLADHDLAVTDLTFIAVGLGPGSFTGLRIGLAVAKGLAWAARKPLIGVPTLEAMAFGFGKASGQICPLIDARHGQLFTAIYRPDSSGRPVRHSDFLSVTPDQLAAMVDRRTTFFGHGLSVWADTLKLTIGDFFHRGPEALDSPHARDVAGLAYELYRQGLRTDPAEVIPLYIRPPDIREKPRP